MQKHERKLIDILALLTIVVSLSSVGSMYVYYMGTFDTFAIPKFIHQLIIVVLGLMSFVYLIYALYMYHRKER